MTLNEMLMVVFEAELCRLRMASPAEFFGFETRSFREQESPSLPVPLWWSSFLFLSFVMTHRAAGTWLT